MDLLTEQLAAAVGLGGRDRGAASSAERARVTVTKAIRAAQQRIAREDAELGAHLEVSVRTGSFCVYRPDPGSPPGPCELETAGALTLAGPMHFVAHGIGSRPLDFAAFTLLVAGLATLGVRILRMPDADWDTEPGRMPSTASVSVVDEGAP